MPSLISSPAKDKSDRKHKSKDGKEKKRKRTQEEDGHKHKSKKHRHDKSADAEDVIVEEEAAAAPAQTQNPDLPKESPFHVQTSSLYLPLAPISQRKPVEGICAEHLSPVILTYYPPFHGVVLSYSNPRLSEAPFQDDGAQVMMKSTDEYAVSWTWVTAEFMLFKPTRGGWLEGYVNLQNEGHLGIVCWNLFNASIERQRLPKDWKWVGAEDLEGDGYAEDGVGYYVDGAGTKIEGIVKFRVKDIESSHDRERGFLSIEGTMLEDKDENELLEEENASRSTDKSMIGRRLGGSRALGATSLGVPVEATGEEEGSRKRSKKEY
jgi:DNA-directed RNA polymerase I subunit RPA43